MKLKLFFIFILIGMSLQAQTQDSTVTDELDVVDELDADPGPAPVVVPVPPAPPAVKEVATPPTPVAAPAPVAPVIIPRVYQILMPTKRQHELTPVIAAAGTTALDKRVDDVKYNYSVVQTGIGYVYGLGNNQSIGADLNYLSYVNRVTFGANEVSQKKYGFANPSIHYKGLFNISSVSIFGYLSYSFKLERETMDTDKKEGNAATGQNKTGFVLGGYKAVNSDYILGAFVNYSLASNGESATKSGSGTEIFKLSKGDRMYSAIFMEVQNEWHPNFALGLSKSFSTETTDEFDNKSYSVNIDQVSLTASGQFQTGANTFFIPEISYSSGLDNDYFKNYNSFSFYGSLRLLF